MNAVRKEWRSMESQAELAELAMEDGSMVLLLTFFWHLQDEKSSSFLNGVAATRAAEKCIKR